MASLMQLPQHFAEQHQFPRGLNEGLGLVCTVHTNGGLLTRRWKEVRVVAALFQVHHNV